MEEQRRSERRAAQLRVDVTEHREGKSFAFEAQDVSVEGLFLAVKKPRAFHLGQTLTMQLQLPGGGGEVRLAGEVVRIVDKAQAKAHGGRPGIGIELVEPRPLLER